jgi:hypothetical protein
MYAIIRKGLILEVGRPHRKKSPLAEDPGSVVVSREERKVERVAMKAKAEQPRAHGSKIAERCDLQL